MSDTAHWISFLERKLCSAERRDARQLARCYSSEEISDILVEFNTTDDRFAKQYIPLSVFSLLFILPALGMGWISNNGNWLVAYLSVFVPYFIMLTVLIMGLRHRRRCGVLALAYYLRKQEESEQEVRKEE